MRKVLKLHQANEDGATDISTQFTPVAIDGSGSSSIEISQDIETDKLSTDKVPSTKAVFDFMSWVPKDIVTNEEFNTGRTLDGEPIYGMYVDNKAGVELSELNLIYATASNYAHVDPRHSENNKNFLYIFSKNYAGTRAIIEYQLPYTSGVILDSTFAKDLNRFIGFIFYTKKK